MNVKRATGTPEPRLSRAAPAEPELVRRAAAGDDDAFRALVEAHLPRLRRWALARTGDPDDADEVVQRALIRMHRGLPDFRGGARLATWLYRIAANAATDLEREAAAGPVARPADSASGPREPAREPAVGGDPIRRIHAGRMAEAVRDFFDGLPPRQREVLELVDHEGARAVDVAEALAISPATVRVHLLKARRALRERILARYPELEEGYDA